MDKIIFFSRVAVDMVKKKKDTLKNLTKDRQLSLLETYLLNENLDERDVIGMACDMLLAGVDTVSKINLLIRVFNKCFSKNITREGK